MAGERIVGGCQCEGLRFELKARPLFAHACHCLDCRRRSGTAFGLKATVLRDDLAITTGELTAKQTSPRTTVRQCAACATTIYSESIRFPSTYLVAGGTFDDASFVVPGAHLWVKRKHPWVVLPDRVPQFDEDGDIHAIWPRSARERLEAANRALSGDQE